MKSAARILKDILYPPVEWARRTIVREAVCSDAIVNRRMRFLPNILYIHPTNTCNARCVFCNYSKNPEKKVIADFDLFCSTIDQWMGFSPRDSFLDVSTNNGDALVDPRLVEKLSYAKSKGVETIWFSTNGILLSRGDLCDKLVRCVDVLGISLPGFDKEDYKRVFGVDKAEQVLEGVIKLAEAKRAARSRIEIQLLFRIDRPSEIVMQDEGMKRLKPYLDDGTIVIPPDQIRMDNLFTWSNIISDEMLPGTMKLRHIDFDPNRRPCRNPFKDVSILPDGKVRVCSCQYMDTNYDELVVGDVREKSLRDVIMDRPHRQLLRDMAEGRWAPVCANCSIYEPINFSAAKYLQLTIDVIVEKAKALVPAWMQRATSAAKRAFFT